MGLIIGKSRGTQRGRGVSENSLFLVETGEGVSACYKLKKEFKSLINSYFKLNLPRL